MKWVMTVALGIASSASGVPSSKAIRFIDDFNATCLAAYGDYEGMRNAANAAGFKKKPYLDHRAGSFFAQRGSTVIVYHGGPNGQAISNGARCSLQSDHVPGGSASDLAMAVEQRLGISTATKIQNCQERPVWKWRTKLKDRDVLVQLVDDRLRGESNTRLEIFPWTEESPNCVEPNVRHVTE